MALPFSLLQMVIINFEIISPLKVRGEFRNPLSTSSFLLKLLASGLRPQCKSSIGNHYPQL